MGRKRREDLTPEVREKIMQDYLTGVKTSVIQLQYKISPGEIYRILGRAHVQVRKPKLAMSISKGAKMRRPGVIFLQRGMSLQWGTLRSSLQELVPLVEEMPIDEAIRLVCKVLIAYMRRDSLATVQELASQDEELKGKLATGFREDEIIKSALALYLTVFLESHPDEFEKVSDGCFRAREQKMKLQIGDRVTIKKGNPGYELWYKGKVGTIRSVTTNDEGETRFLVHLPRSGAGIFNEEITLPFGQWELEKVNEENQAIVSV